MQQPQNIAQSEKKLVIPSINLNNTESEPHTFTTITT